MTTVTQQNTQQETPRAADRGLVWDTLDSGDGDQAAAMDRLAEVAAQAAAWVRADTDKAGGAE